MMPTIKMRMKIAFFDAERVMRAVDKARREVMSRQGAFVRTAARSLIRTRKGPSAPGSPPHGHTGLLRRFLYFAFDAEAETVVIGPERLRTALDVGGETQPQVLEYGGAVAVHEVQSRGEWRRRSARGVKAAFAKGARVRTRRARVAARPYMAPAFESAKRDLAKAWEGAVK